MEDASLTMRVAVTCTHLQRDIDTYRQVLADHGLDVHLPSVAGQELAGAELVNAMVGVEGVIAGDDHFDESVLAQLPNLRAISKWGIGLDGIDLVAAERRGIKVTNTPGMFGNEVAEQALAYLLVLIRGICQVNDDVRRGGWPKPVGRSLGSLRIGVFGLGDIGRSLATKLQQLGATVLGSDPAPSANAWAETAGVGLFALQELAGRVDVLCVTAPLNESTKGVVDEELLAEMPSGSWLINVGRGPIVRGDAVVRALHSGHLAGAALDVYEVEPLEDDLIRSAPNMVLGSHNASNTLEACHRTHLASIANLVDSLSK